MDIKDAARSLVVVSAPEPQLMTVEDLVRLPDDGKFYELDEGRLVVMPPAQYRSSVVSARALARIAAFVDQHDLGVYMGEQGGVVLRRNPDTVRAPDISFIRR